MRCAIAALFLWGPLALAQVDTGELRVSAVDIRREPVAASVLIRATGSEQFQHASVTGSKEAYSITLPSGVYDIEIGLTWFFSETIRGVQLEKNQIRTLPPIELVFEGMCSFPRVLEYYYQPLNPVGPAAGAVTGYIFSSDGEPVGGTTVLLYAPGLGRIATTATDSKGRFTITGIPARRDYWIRTSHAGYFDDEFTGLNVQAGFETAYERLDLESCDPGRCLPSLKTIRVIPACE